MFIRATLVVALVCLPSCVMRVGAAEPRPSVDLAQSRLSLGLDLRAVPDAFKVESKNGIRGVSVEEWQTTLRSGFQAGIAPFFARSSPPDVTLRFLKADLDYTPAAVWSDGSGAVAVRARITYMAQLIDRNGQVLARMRGEAISKNESWRASGAEDSAAEAAAVMFEDIADQQLRALGGGTSAAAAPRDACGGCDEGTLCHKSQCISACNPGCRSDERCTDARQCVKTGVTTF